MIAIYTLISLAILGLIVFGPMNGYRVDKLRQDLFAIRGDLFMDAAAGKIPFDSPAYGYTRLTINGMLRFAHRLSLSRCMMVLMLVDQSDVYQSKMQQERAFAAVSESDRELSLKYLNQVNERLFTHVVSSPFALLLVPLFAAAVTLITGASLASWGVKKCRGPFSKLDALAFEEGRTVLSKGHSMSAI